MQIPPSIIGNRFLQKGASPKHYRAAGLRRIHRLRAEHAFGRPLPAFVKVHHVDGSRDPWAPLVICQDEAYHKLLHLRIKIRAAGGDPNTDKVCAVCRRPKPLAAFGLDRHGPLGRQGTCKACACARFRAKYAANPECYRQRSRDSRAKHRR